MLAPHEHEILKASVHGAMGALIVVCLLYNAAAWWLRPKGTARHNALNALVYAGLAGWEVAHVRHHVAQRRTA